MTKKIDETGNVYDRLTVLGFDEKKSEDTGRPYWKVKCVCGTLKSVRTDSLRDGSIRSCGCLQKEVARELCLDTKTTHGKSKTKIYKLWKSMKNRCYNKNEPTYLNYGGRGIKVCDRWLESFENFFEDMGERPPGLTLERIDNDKDYSPDNCKWVTPKEQANNRRSNVIIEHDGKIMNLSQWSKEVGIKPATIRQRLKKGWTIERALTEKVRGRNN